MTVLPDPIEFNFCNRIIFLTYFRDIFRYSKISSSHKDFVRFLALRIANKEEDFVNEEEVVRLSGFGN